MHIKHTHDITNHKIVPDGCMVTYSYCHKPAYTF